MIKDKKTHDLGEYIFLLLDNNVIVDLKVEL